MFNAKAFERFSQLFHGQWNDDVVNLLQLCIALGAFWVIAWGYRLHQEKRGAYKQRDRDLVLLALGLAGGFAYSNFGNLHFGNFIHAWDTYHYYMGAKYFPEVNYDRLYDCAMVSDAEDAKTPEELKKVGDRAITDLRTNVMLKASEVLKHPEDCKQHFTEARWREYKQDVAFFKSRVNGQRWVEVHQDHGYNATPVWTLLGHALADTGPATLDKIVLLNLLDPLYLLLTAVLLWWAFGPRVFAVGLIMLGTNFPNRYYWTGGAYLRHDWVFYFVAVVCLLKKEKYWLAGAALSYSTLLRLFPGLLAIGPLAAGIELYRLRGQTAAGEAAKSFKERIDPGFAKFVAGGLIATLLLVGSSFVFVGGVETWKRFVNNSVKHAGTPLTNHMGLRTVLSYRPSDIGARTRDGTLIDAWSKWKEHRLENWNQLKPLFWLTMLAACVALYFAARGTQGELWVSASLGAGLIAFGSELTCYYYCFLMAMAPLHEKRREAGLMLIALAAATQFIAWTPFAGMSGWLDEQYTAMSVLTLAAIGSLWWLFTEKGAVGALPPEPETTVRLIPLLAGGPSSSSRDDDRAERKKKKKKR
jgi:hypothetical protein